MSQIRRARVLVVDDSPTVRSLVRRLLHREDDLEVVGEAADGARAVELVEALHPDVVIMDIEMPVLDGLAAIERMAARRPTPVVILTARESKKPALRTFEASRCGAVEVLAKPAAPEGWQELHHTLVHLVRALAASHRARAEEGPTLTPPPPSAPARQLRFLAIAASTGGPEAVYRLLQPLPKPLPVAALVVQHIAAGFEESLASWLAGKLGADVAVARHGEAATPGIVRLAPPGAHLVLAADATIGLDRTTPARAGHRPSADELFFSCARAFPAVTAGIVLTGMGADGAEGLAELRRCGGLTLAQDAGSSVVYGMPKAAVMRGAVEIALPPEQLGALLARSMAGGAP